MNSMFGLFRSITLFTKFQLNFAGKTQNGEKKILKVFSKNFDEQTFSSQTPQIFVAKLREEDFKKKD